MRTFNKQNAVIVAAIQAIIFQLLLLMLCFLPATGMEAEDAPESVTLDYLQELYDEVVFDHQTHSEMYDCNACHHHTTGTGAMNENCRKCHDSSPAADDVSCSGCHDYQEPGRTANKHTTDNNTYHIDKPGLKGALHLQCLGCHRVENGPTGCLECHNFTPAGRKRFAIKN